MAAFADTEDLYNVMEELWKRIGAHKEISEKLLKTRLVVRFVYREPHGWVTIDGSDGETLKVTVDQCDVKPVIEMRMKSDFAHNFWQGKENPTLALMQGKIVSTGPVNKALALLPAVKPAFSIYNEVIEDLRKAA
jgi:2-oxoisovalerate dehydrogenase E1 component